MAEVTIEHVSRRARELFEKGVAAVERNNLDYAMDMFTAALTLEPGFLKARKFLRAAEIKVFKTKKSPALIHAVSSVKGIGACLKTSSLLKKKPEEALKAAEALMRIDPLHLPFINLLVQAATAASMPEVAIQTLEVAKEHHPGNIDIIQRLGRLFIDNNEPHRAKACFEEVVKLKPNDPAALKELKDAAALDTMKQGGWTDAGSYRDVIKDTKEAVTLEQESKAVKSDQDIENLIAETERKITKEPQNINYRRALADLLTRVHRFDEALTCITEAETALGRSDPQLELTTGNIKIKKYDYEIAQLSAAGDQSAADTLKQEKDTYLLQEAAQRVKHYPNDLQFKYEYGVLLFERQQWNNAIEEFQQSQRNPQRRTQSLYYLARCFKQKQQLDIAVEQLEKAASELSQMTNIKKDILYELGELCEAIGDKQKAADYFKQIYAVDIKYRDIAEKIDKTYNR